MSPSCWIAGALPHWAIWQKITFWFIWSVDWLILFVWLLKNWNSDRMWSAKNLLWWLRKDCHLFSIRTNISSFLFCHCFSRAESNQILYWKAYFFSSRALFIFWLQSLVILSFLIKFLQFYSVILFLQYIELVSDLSWYISCQIQYCEVVKVLNLLQSNLSRVDCPFLSNLK